MESTLGLTLRYLTTFAFLLTTLQNPSPSTLKARSPQQKQSSSTQQPASTNDRGTHESPIFVKQLPPEKTEVESAQEVKDRQQQRTNEGRLVNFTLWLVLATLILAFVGVLQLFVFSDQAKQLRKTVKSASDQSIDMKNSIAEAARAAKAMEDVARHFERSVTQAQESTAMFSKRGEMQMRAYLGVEVGTAAFQVRPQNIKFGAATGMLNVGATPAHKVGFVAEASVLPVPLPDDFAFPLPPLTEGGLVLGPHQKMTITRFVKDFVPDEQVEDIKVCKGQGLYIWGIIEYVDVFSAKHTTRFCQILNWGADGKTVFGTYISRHNDAT